MTPERLQADGSAFCIAHRLRYDPRLSLGCVLCQRALMPNAPAPARHDGLLAPVLLGTLVGMLGAFGLELAPLAMSQPGAASVNARSSAKSALGFSSSGTAPALRGGASSARAAQPKVPVVPSDAELANQTFVGDPHVPPLPSDAPQVGLPGAAVHGDLDAIKAQLEAHAAIDAQDGAGRAPLHWAILANRPDAARLLIESGARIDLAMHTSHTPLMLAAQRGMEAVSALMLERGSNPADADRDGLTALMWAARGDHAGVVASLLAHHAPVEERDAKGRSALMHAALTGASAATIASLLDHHAALEGRDIYGAPALLLAVSNGNEASVRALLARGAALDARGHNGWSALDCVVQPHDNVSQAASSRLAATLQLLIEHGIDPRLTIDPARNEIMFRPVLEKWYARIGLEPLPPYRGNQASGNGAAQQQLDSPATVQLLEPNDLNRELTGKTAATTLIGYRGWTRVPAVAARAVLRGVSLYGAQQATLVGQASGEGKWRVADVLLLELMQDGRLVDIAFVGAADGVEVDHAGVRRLGDQGYEHTPGAVDLTPWLSVDGRELVVTVLASFRRPDMSTLYLRIDGEGARRTLAHAEVDRSGQGGSL